MTESKSTVPDRENLTPFQKDLVAVLNHNELYGGRGAYRSQHAGTAKSGYSFGYAQHDLGTNPEARKAFLAMLRKFGRENPEILGGKARSDIQRALEQGDKKEIERHKDAINHVLSGEAGKATINAMAPEQLSKLVKEVDDVVETGESNPLAKDFVNSREGKVAIADLINQYGNANTFRWYVSGKEVSIDGAKVKLDRKLDWKGYVEYVNRFKYAKANPDDAMRRLENIADVTGTRKQHDDAVTAIRLGKFTPPRKPEPPKREDKPSAPGGEAKDGGKGGGETPAQAAGGDSPVPGQRIAVSGEELPEHNTIHDLREKPEIVRLVDDLRAPGSEVAEIALKDPGEWTLDEAGKVMAGRLRLVDNDPEVERLGGLERTFYASHWPGSGRRDATGRSVVPDDPPTLPETPAPARTREGEPLDAALNRFAPAMGRLAAKESVGKAVESLQKGLNILNGARSEGTIRSPLKVDGVFGPKTKSGLR